MAKQSLRAKPAKGMKLHEVIALGGTPADFKRLNKRDIVANKKK